MTQLPDSLDRKLDATHSQHEYRHNPHDQGCAEIRDRDLSLRIAVIIIGAVLLLTGLACLFIHNGM